MVSGVGCLGMLWLVLYLPGPAAASPAQMFNPGNFIKVINNPYFPLKPGEVFIYSGITDEGPEVLQIYVSHQKKMILGVECAVVNETVTTDGILTEVSINWYAQDKEGNVWYFGEDSKQYEDGEVASTEGSWEAGINGAQQGIIMEAHPQVGDIYHQEFAPGAAMDMARILSKKKEVTVPYGEFDRCLFTKEWSQLDPGVVEFKYYAKGVGFVLGITGGKKRLALRDVFFLPE